MKIEETLSSIHSPCSRLLCDCLCVHACATILLILILYTNSIFFFVFFTALLGFLLSAFEFYFALMIKYRQGN